MFSKYFKKDKPRVFLGTIAVVPMSEWQAVDEGWFRKKEDLNIELRESLEEIFTLPSVDDDEEPLSNDLVLDVMIPKYLRGECDTLDFGTIGGFPFFWRPKVQIKSRLYNLKTNKTKATYSVTEKISWMSFYNRVFSFRGLLRYKPLFDKEDLNPLLYMACYKMLVKLQKEHGL